MIRKIIKIDEEKCTGCGLCAEACHEGAIGMVNGKAKLLRDDYCDGMGRLLGRHARQTPSHLKTEKLLHTTKLQFWQTSKRKKKYLNSVIHSQSLLAVARAQR